MDNIYHVFDQNNTKLILVMVYFLAEKALPVCRDLIREHET